MGDHLNEREIVPHVESCRELNDRLLDYRTYCNCYEGQLQTQNLKLN